MSAKKQFTLANGCFNLNEWFDTDCISIAVADSASVAMRWWKNITTYYGQLLGCPVPRIFLWFNVGILVQCLHSYCMSCHAMLPSFGTNICITRKM